MKKILHVGAQGIPRKRKAVMKTFAFRLQKAVSGTLLRAAQPCCAWPRRVD
jgi:hypothetical protein